MTHEDLVKTIDALEAELRQQAQSVDALLATTCSRLLNAAAKVNEMRILHQQQNVLAYWQLATVAAEQLTVAGHAITEAHRILLAKQGLAIGQDGGLIN
jgi:methionine synthase I (cobalamin-dependent)